jgi:hypothetical protein
MGAITPVTFSYLPASQLNSQSYPSASDYRVNFPDWANIVKAQAYTQFKHAFDQLPAIVKQPASPLYGGEPGAGFQHTVYVSGLWKDAMGQTPQVFPACKNLNDPNQKPECSLSYLYYLSYMDQAQQALGYLLSGGAGQIPPVSPPYPPTTPLGQTQFQQIMAAIGFGIGTGAAHETGHQLFLPHMDCGIPGTATCAEDRIYENGVGTSTHEWFYGNLPGVKIHWSQEATCALQKYLLGSSAPPCN